MNSKNITTGITLIFIGVILILSHFNYIEFNWFAVIRLWPLFLILLGIKVLISRNNPYRENIILGSTLGVLIIIGAVGILSPRKSFFFLNFNDDKNVKMEYDYMDTTNAKDKIVIANNDSIQKAKLNLQLGATVLSNTPYQGNNILEMANSRKNNLLEYSSKTENGQIEIDVDMNNDNKKGFVKNNTVLSLNKNLVWDLNLDLGASSTHLDLSSYRIQNISVDLGASSLDLKLGNPEVRSTVDLDIGAAALKLMIPKGAAYSLEYDGALSSFKIPSGLIQGEDDVYKTPNFDQAKTKYVIKLDGGISDVNLTTY